MSGGADSQGFESGIIATGSLPTPGPTTDAAAHNPAHPHDATTAHTASQPRPEPLTDLLATAMTRLGSHPKSTVSSAILTAAVMASVSLAISFGMPVVAAAAAFPPARWTSAAPFSGLDRNTSIKWGGALISDLDSDGWYDLVLHNHDRTPLAVYWNTQRTAAGPAKAFTRGRDLFNFRFDAHGLTSGDIFLRGTEAVVSSQGGGYGSNPGKPFLLRHVDESEPRVFGRADKETGLEAATPGGRGRTPLLIDCDGDGDLDLIFLNFVLARGVKGDRQHVVENRGGRFVRRWRTGLENADVERAIITDFDGDGRLDVVAFPLLHLFRATGNCAFEDVTAKWMARVPDGARIGKNVWAAAELDANNDGRWDLYLAKNSEADALLLNVNNDHFVLGAPPAGSRRRHHDVTIGDFNNDGNVDVFLSSQPPAADGVTPRRRPDALLTGDGAGGFVGTTEHGATVVTAAGGDSVQALDFDRDGRLDLLVGSGPEVPSQGPLGGWRLFHGASPLPAGGGGHWLEVSVGRSPDRRAAPTGALLTLTVNGGGGGRRTLVRRVGGAGGAGSTDNLRVVHFGLGEADTVESLVVRWSDGVRVRRTQVPVDAVYEVTAV